MALVAGKSFPSIGFFSKTFVFQNLGGRLDRKLHQDALLESTGVIKNANFMKNVFEKNHAIFRITIGPAAKT